MSINHFNTNNININNIFSTNQLNISEQLTKSKNNEIQKNNEMLKNNEILQNRQILKNKQISQQTRQSLMSMMKQIMQKSYLYNDQLHYIPEQSIQQSTILYHTQQQSQQHISQYDNKNDKINSNITNNIMKNNIIKSDIIKNNNDKQDKQRITDNFINKNTMHKTPLLSLSQNNIKLSPMITNINQLSQSLQNQSNHQFSKLIQITQRCVSYYNNFMIQKQQQIRVIEKTFDELSNNLSIAFQQMIIQLRNKQKQLKQFLYKKYIQIIKLRQQQNQSLKSTLQQIKQVHLQKLINQQFISINQQTPINHQNLFINAHKQSNQQYLQNISSLQSQKYTQNISSKSQKQSKNNIKLLINPKQINQRLSKTQLNIHKQNNSFHNQYNQQKPYQFSLQIHNYATTLNHFYFLMQEIQKSNFKEIVQESINFIHNLITQEIKSTLFQKIPSKLTQKKMIRQNSTDFLLESQSNLLQTKSIPNYNFTPSTNKQNNFSILDAQSFTKLFFQSQTNQHNGKNNINKLQQNMTQIQKIKNQNQTNLAILQQFSSGKKIHPQIKLNPQDKIVNTINIKEEKYPQQIKQQQFNSNFTKNSYQNQKYIPQNHKLISHSNKHEQNISSKSNFNKKQSYQSISSPSQKISKHISYSQKQNSLQLIKKISTQQTNRSAKIKGYLVTFQDSKSNLTENKKYQTSKPNKQSKSPNNVSKSPNKLQKSPNKLSKTPIKTSKSTQKKSLTSSILTTSNQQKLKNYQQISMKSSRNATIISEFKITSCRRQSLIGK